METVIQVENISKQYVLGQIGTGTLRDDFYRFWAKVKGKDDPTLKLSHTNTLTTDSQHPTPDSKYVWALRDINFEVKQGEVLGIIGKNGAGKSTLLKILSKVTAPTSGNVKVKGRIASLLEVGTGFHQDLSGRENIFLNGAILGMSKAEIRSKFDEIVDFSGIEKYIDTPVKRYSSGMYVRLAFAVAAHLEPEILIVDEVLAVGDAEFQKKCLGKMKDVSGHGRTVLFVSHNMPSILELCTRGILLSEGKIIEMGNTEAVVKKYLNVHQKVNESNDLSVVSNRTGDGKIRFTAYRIMDAEGSEVNRVFSGQQVSFRFDFISNTDEILPPLHFSMKIVKEDDSPLFHVSNSVSRGEEFKFRSVIKKGNVTCRIEKFPLQPGEYFFHLFCSDLMTVYDHIDFAGTLHVDPGNFFPSGKLPLKNQGEFLVENNWSIQTA